MATERDRENRRRRQVKYAYNPETKRIEKLSKWIRIPKPMLVLYIPHYEESLRMEFPIPKEEEEGIKGIQKTLNDYKQIFVKWFGNWNSIAHRFESWNKQTRLWVYASLRSKTRNFKEPVEEQSRALKSLLLYPKVLQYFREGKTRTEIAKFYSMKGSFRMPVFRKGKLTGRYKEVSRSESTIQRDITSLVKSNVIKRVRKGIYKVVK